MYRVLTLNLEIYLHSTWYLARKNNSEQIDSEQIAHSKSDYSVKFELLRPVTASVKSKPQSQIAVVLSSAASTSLSYRYAMHAMQASFLR